MAEYLDQHLASRRVVVDDEDGHAFEQPIGLGRPFLAGGIGCDGQREREPETASFTEFAVQLYFTAHAPHQFVGNG